MAKKKRPTIPAEITKQDTNDTFGFVDSLVKQARSYAPAAMETLKKILDDTDAAPVSRIAAARGILEYAAGKPSTPPPPAPENNLTIIVNKLVTGEKTERFLQVQEGELRTAIEIAGKLNGDPS